MDADKVQDNKDRCSAVLIDGGYVSAGLVTCAETHRIIRR